jgi:hypothetical protein
MPRSGASGGRQTPLDDRELLISALNYKPMDRILTDDPANLALEFLQTRHAFSVEQWLAKDSIAAKAGIQLPDSSGSAWSLSDGYSEVLALWRLPCFLMRAAVAPSG